eukprot:gi/632989571/ref/XP_007883721.1/ PREDICTED: protein RTF2 homolog [Callorhinchus milii]
MEFEKYKADKEVMREQAEQEKQNRKEEQERKEIAQLRHDKCREPFQRDDVIFLNGSKEEMEILKRRVEERKLKAKLERKAKTSKTISKPTATEGN